MSAPWKERTLGETCNIVNGGTPDTSVKKFWDGGVPWITPAEMGRLSDPYIAETRRTLTKKGLENSSARLLPTHSVILSSRAPIGHLAINNVPMATNQGCKGLIPGGELHYKFLYYYLKSITASLDELGSGTTFREISGTTLKAVCMPVAPLSEQRRLVAILDKTFKSVTVAKANTEANVINVRSLFASERSKQFSGGSAWIETRIDRLASNLDSRRVPITKRDRTNGPFPYYGASGIVDYVADFIFDEDTLLVSEDGANLLARSTPIAFSVSGKYWVNNHAHVLRFLSPITQEYVRHYLESIRIDEFVTGAAQPKLTQGALNSIPILIPQSIAEQQAVVSRIEWTFKASRALQGSYEKKVVALDDLRQSFLQAAFSGAL